MDGSGFIRFVERSRADLYRYNGARGAAGFFRVWWREPGFRLICHMRLCRALRETPLTRWGVYHLVKFFYGRSCVRYGVYLDPFMELGGGLFLPHPCAIIVNSRVVMGANCNLSQGATIGVGNRGNYPGVPIIGSRVFIGPGAVILGGITVGDGAAIGANAVVTRPVEAGTVAVGSPARCVPGEGSDGYINFVPEELDA
jgi:serine O-acetyltransferase